MKLLNTLLFFLFFSFIGIGQTCQLDGNITDESGPLPMIAIQIDSVFTQSDVNGKYSITLPFGTYQVTIQSPFYQNYTQTIELNQAEQTLNIRLIENVTQLKEVVLQFDRTAFYEKDVTGTQTHLEKESIKEQTAISNNLNDVLSKTVVGIAPSTESASSFGQGLRGRQMAIFIDGVPQSTPLRTSSRVLRSIETSNLESIDIIRGASALYGYGATGGIIDFKTKNVQKEGISYDGRLSSRTFPSKLNVGLGYHIGQKITMKKKKFSMIVNATYEKTSRYIDGEGDYIPVDPIGQGGTADNSIYNTFFKGAYQIDSTKSLALTYLFYQAEQNSNLKTLPGIVGLTKSTVFQGEQRGLPPATINHNISASYFHKNIFKTTDFSLVAFYQNIKARYNYSDFFQGQSFVQSEKYGSRMDLISYFSPKFRTHYGLDLLSDQTEQSLEDGRIWMPKIKQNSIAPFIQLKYDVSKKLLVKGGIRYEIASLDVPTFKGIQTIDTVQGGMIYYQTPLLNASILYKIHEKFQPNISFSQGFSLADIGRVVRALDAPSIESLSLDAMVVNNYELGFYGKFKHWKYTISGYISTSEFGSSYQSYPDIKVVRAPERIYGMETSISIQFLPKWTFTNTISYLEGKVDTDDDKKYETYLNGTRIPPFTSNFALKYKPSNKFYAQIQTIYVGNRNRFPTSTDAYEGQVKAYTSTDLLLSHKVWKGNLSFAVNNIFNQFYFPAISQWANSGEGYTAGLGINCSITYQYNLSK